MTERKERLHRGLREVYIDRTTSSFIDGDVGKLLYRGYNIDDLAQNSTFEETAFLVMYGHLPSQAELDAFDAELKNSRSLPAEILDIIRLTRNSHPMDVLRTAVSALSAYDPDTEDNSTEATLRKGVRLTAQAPTIVAAHARIREGKEALDPDPELGHAANFLYMLFGERPAEEDAALIDKDFVLHAEHGINASAFGARVTASTQADLHCAITTGIGVLKGPSHGGAAEEVMKMTQEIGEEENAETYVRERLQSGGRIMGLRTQGLQGPRPEVRTPAGRRERAWRAQGRTQVVPDTPVRHRGDGALSPPRNLPERRFLLRRHLLPAGHSRRPVHIHLRDGTCAGMDSPGRRTVRKQHPAAPQASLHRADGCRVRANRRQRLGSVDIFRHFRLRGNPGVEGRSPLTVRGTESKM